MAAEQQAVGYGFGEEEGYCVDIDDVEREGPKTVVDLSEPDAADLGDKRGSDLCPEDATCDEHEDSQVAKKPRTEKVENGGGAGNGVVEASGNGVDADDDAVEKPKTEYTSTVGGNGADKTEDKSEEVSEEQDFGNGKGFAAKEDDDHTEEAASGEKSKDGHGAVGLRTLLQEGDDTKSNMLNTDLGDATHMLNGAK